MSDLSLLPPEKQEAILNGPALKPPPGVESKFDDPPNQNVIPHAVIPICLLLATLAVVIRTYAKFFLLRRVNVDDALISLGFGTYIAYIYCVYYAIDLVGFFVHQWDATMKTVSRVQHVLHFGAGFYAFTLLFVKAAILLQWIRLFAPNGTRGPFFWACQILLWSNILFYTSILVAGNLVCMPFERIWDKTVPGVCYNGRPVNTTIGAFNLISDIIILVLPQRVIWRLNMSRKRKIGVALIFAVGLIACAAAAFRLGVTVVYMSDPDWLYRVSGLSMACIGEMTCIILVYCLPGIPKAFSDSTILSKLFVSIRSSLRSEKYKNVHEISLEGYSNPKAHDSQSTKALRNSQGDYPANSTQDWLSDVERSHNNGLHATAPIR